MEIIAFVVIIYQGYLRLSRVANPLELEYFKKSCTISLLFGSFFFALVVPFAAVSPTFDSIVANPIAEVVGSVGVMISLMFITVDARSSSSMIQDLCSLADMKTLTLQHVLEVKKEISIRVHSSHLMNTGMAVMAILHSITFLLMVVVRFQAQTVSELDVQVPLGVALLLKEVLYLILALYEITSVNEIADKLHKMLGDSVWLNNNDNDVKMEESKPLCDDHCRVRICINLNTDPISFRLLGTRPTKKSVFLQATGYCFSLLVIVLKFELEGS